MALVMPMVFAGLELVFETDPNCAISLFVFGTPFIQLAAVFQEVELVEFQVLVVCALKFPLAPKIAITTTIHFPNRKPGTANIPTLLQNLNQRCRPVAVFSMHTPSAFTSCAPADGFDLFMAILGLNDRVFIFSTTRGMKTTHL